MGCGCSNTTPFFQGYNTQYYSSNNCQSSGSGSCGTTDGIGYSGPNLNCSGVDNGDSLTVALQKMDTAICTNTGDYSTYNTYCLSPITTQQQFVEKISQYVCNLSTTVNTFIDTTFPAYQTTVTNEFNAINNPAITCSFAGVTSADNLISVLNKYCSAFGTLNTAISLSGVTWGSCFTVSPAPTTIAAGFNTLISQICQLKSEISSGGLPTFNNLDSCLSGGTANDSLVTTVNLLKTQVCSCPTFDINSLTWNCVTKPSEAGVTDLQDAFAALMAKVDTLSQEAITTYSGDFVVTSTNPDSACAGKSIALTTPIANNDRLVAATTSDTAPGTLQQKVTPGAGITLDFATTPGQMIINSTASGSTYQVKATSGDPNPGYLVSKLEGSSDNVSGLFLTILSDTTTNKAQVSGTIDLTVLVPAILSLVQNTPSLQASWCAINANCPSACPAPTNIQAIYTPGGTTTTTTSTSTTTTTSSTTTTTTTTV
jgi:hypothetical protein